MMKSDEDRGVKNDEKVFSNYSHFHNSTRDGGVWRRGTSYYDSTGDAGFDA
jgi:hypothetical protein